MGGYAVAHGESLALVRSLAMARRLDSDEAAQ
jgi:hypothetical protein